MNRRLLSTAVCAAALFHQVGCSSEPEPKPLGADQFYRPTDKGGALPPGPAARTEAPQPVPTPIEQKNSGEGFTFVEKQVQSPTAPDTAATTTAPAANFVPGQYMSVGGVVAEVNGNPIYADDVLRAIAPSLSARAKDLELSKYKLASTNEVSRQVDDMIRAEVEFAAASRNTSSEDKKLAERATEAWRMRMITENRGSIEETRQKFRDQQGKSFDDVAKEQYRLNLVRVYYSKKLFPRIQVTAEDMRKFYEKNRGTLFTNQDKYTFRLIKAGAKENGSDEAAKQKINDLAERAQRGEDFEMLTGFNQDPVLLKSKGLIGPLDRGSYVLEDIEKALWQLNAGQVTPVIHIGDAYYIAKLEEKKPGRTMNFEEEAVQKKMQESLRSEQFSKMRAEMEAQLRKESVVTKNPQMLQTAVDMAVQNYSHWRG